MTVYRDGTNVRCVILNRETGDSSYARFYYYENGKIIFAYLESFDSHRLYFKDEKLFRWRYAANAADAASAVNYDQTGTGDFVTWEDFVLKEAYKYM